MKKSDLSAALDIDAVAESDRIARAIREQVGGPLKRRGVVLGLSGGIDSSVCAALAVRALGPKRVLGLFMPE
jgi:NAD+ synthase